ncbi:MAG: DUF721 domain-containing protein [Desulfovibrio sp.]|jgi:hypothetical protein|nr:DUF721 domain-containing protein [Desulfovibrio sp.]
MRRNSQAFPRERRCIALGEAALAFLDSRGGKRTRHLAALWQNWSVVMGENLAGLAFPLGHKDALLLIGAEDSMALQELSLQSPEILQRVNAFMDGECFRRVNISLLQSRQLLLPVRPRLSDIPLRPSLPPKPRELGSLVGKLNPASPVARCYEAYVMMFSER